MNTKKWSFVFTVLILIVAFTCQAFAGELDQKEKELDQVKKDIEEKKEAIDQVENEQQDILKQIEQIENSLKEKEQELNQTKDKLRQTQDQIEQIKLELDQTMQKIDEQDELMSARLRALYMNGPSGYLEIIFESENLNDFIHRVETLERVVSYDLQILEELQQRKKEVEQKKLELEQKEQEILEDKQQIEIQQKKIEQQKQEKDRLMQELEEQKQKHKEALDELERNSKELEQVIKDLQKKLEEQRKKQQQESGQSNRGQYTGGKVGWPVPGYYTITSPYAMRVHPITGQYKMHTGIDISCPYGTSVVAAEGGTVILADWYGAYGNTVIIDHGGGLSTLYAHNSSFSVSVGQTVSKGQKIANAGSTGYSTGPHCHFEVRINGNHTNPLNYLK